MGIMTEACRALIWKLKTTDLPYITATHDRKNPGSGRVMEKIGMNYQYSYEEQWQPKDILVVFRMYQLNFDADQDRVYKNTGTNIRFTSSRIWKTVACLKH